MSKVKNENGSVFPRKITFKLPMSRRKFAIVVVCLFALVLTSFYIYPMSKRYIVASVVNAMGDEISASNGAKVFQLKDDLMVCTLKSVIDIQNGVIE